MCAPSANSKKKALEDIADIIASDAGQIKADVFDALSARERLGTTGFGGGVAIPHCRMNSVSEPVACLIYYQQPIDFDAVDGAPVDLLFILLVPDSANQTHLTLLASLAEKLQTSDLADKLRTAQNSDQLFDLARST